MDRLALSTQCLGGDGDLLTGITISPLGEQYLGVFEEGGVGSTVVEPRTSETLHVLDFGESTNNTESGLLLLFRKGAPEDNEAAAIMVEE